MFDAGTIDWSFGLDNGTGGGNAGGPVDPAMQQAMVNILADMGAQPATLMAGLTPATPSTDTTPPTSTITSPSTGATFSDGAQVTISGTATDAGGGVVAGVEISTDGGSTWHPVTTMSAANTSVTWSYSWIAHGYPTTTIKTRAVDDSGNLETPGPGVTVQVGCPCSIWGTNVTPATPDSGDSASTEVGVQFQSDTNGYITGIRFYKASANTGTHVGNLWTSTGQLLASATFTNETASGWQQVNFSQPVAITQEHHLRRVLLRAQRALLRGRLLLLHNPAAGDESHHHQCGQPAVACPAEHQRRRQRRLLRLQQQHLPDQFRQCFELLCGPGLLPGVHQPARLGGQRQRVRGQRLSECHLVRPDVGRSGHDLHRHALHRIDRPDPDHSHRRPGADLGHGDRAD